MSFKLSWRTHIICFFMSLFLTFLLGNTKYTIIENFIMEIYPLYPEKFLILTFFLSVILLLIPMIAVHEAIHGITYTIFGGRVKYGFKGIYAYTMEVSEKPIERTKFLIVLLMPVIIISLLSMLLPSWLGGIIYFLNLLGSTGDLYMAILLIKLDNNSKIIDKSYGFDVV